MSVNSNIYLLSDKNIDGVNTLPIIEINYIPRDIDLDCYDALIFTSKNAVKGLNNITKYWKKIPSYAIAPQTAKFIKDLGGYLAYEGKKHHGNEFALELIEQLKGKKVLYIRGSKIVSDLVEILNSNNIKCDQSIVYSTSCKKYNNLNLPKESIIIFSSPSTIKCFFDNNLWDDSFKAVCIGNTTAKYIPKDIKYFISKETSLESCIKKANELLGNNFDLNF
ncbi:MAG: uroporphyrinogen-III synthase [Campylobacterota bacterium]|nr:uroporphyrinogen-III synthase [Campylobacterota bacterium]